MLLATSRVGAPRGSDGASDENWRYWDFWKKQLLGIRDWQVVMLESERRGVRRGNIPWTGSVARIMTTRGKKKGRAEQSRADKRGAK
jgi:hypothetical protein